MAAAAKTHIAEKGGNPKIVTVVGLRRGRAGARLRAGQEARSPAAPRAAQWPAWARPSGSSPRPVAFDLVAQPQACRSTTPTSAQIEGLFQELEREGAATLPAEPASDGGGALRAHPSTMRFVGQGAETDRAHRAQSDFTKLEQSRRSGGASTTVYQKLYGRTYPDSRGGVRQLQGAGQPARAALPAAAD
ncbi:MAG: hypothetical protein MZW92_70965 [Comamonadaceae bacterium]|nr:hypothetical protein [Comamonadaceae bacterium]